MSHTLPHILTMSNESVHFMYNYLYLVINIGNLNNSHTDILSDNIQLSLNLL